MSLRRIMAARVGRAEELLSCLPGSKLAVYYDDDNMRGIHNGRPVIPAGTLLLLTTMSMRRALQREEIDRADSRSKASTSSISPGPEERFTGLLRRHQRRR